MLKGSDINCINKYHYTFILYTSRISEEIRSKEGQIVGMFSDRGRVCVFVIDGDVIDGKDQHDQ